MNEAPARWTIDQLARLTAAALAVGTIAPQPNGRIREVPDVRTIRYYTSIGLLDRPAAMRGRTALYGRRHLAQLVAIKRLQAGGMTLSEVQERLLGVDAAAVERIALLPTDAELDELDELDGSGVLEPLHEGEQSATDEAMPRATSPERRERFWSARPTSATAAPTAEAAPLPIPPLLSGIRLAPDVTLLLSAVPTTTERAAIAEAAQPLLDLLHQLGLSER